MVDDDTRTVDGRILTRANGMLTIDDNTWMVDSNTLMVDSGTLTGHG
jgi:hypothetical protein